jgi:glycosyltransferase involved in cell wall biosynthesis
MLSTRSEAGRGASMTAARRAGTLSVIVPVLNEEANIPELVRRLKAALAGGLPFDVIFVDDGSTDRTSSLLRALHSEDSRIKSIHLTRTFGQAAISAGLQAATGDVVIVMDGDLQDAPEVVPQFVTRWLDGDDACTRSAGRGRPRGSSASRTARSTVSSRGSARSTFPWTAATSP